MPGCYAENHSTCNERDEYDDDGSFADSLICPWDSDDSCDGIDTIFELSEHKTKVGTTVHHHEDTCDKVLVKDEDMTAQMYEQCHQQTLFNHNYQPLEFCVAGYCKVAKSLFKYLSKRIWWWKNYFIFNTIHCLPYSSKRESWRFHAG